MSGTEHAEGDPQEQMEQMMALAKGPKGDQGERGMPPGQRRAIVYLSMVELVLIAVAYFAISHQADVSQAAQQRTQQAAQRAGEEIEQKLCSIFGGIAALKPPPGNPATNPSRAYDQHLHVKLAEVGPALECPR